MCDFSETTIDVRDDSLNSSCKDAAAKIVTLRQSVDNIDNAVISLLAERFRTTRSIGELKAKAGFAPADAKRESEQISRLLELAKAAGLDAPIAIKYHEFVVTEAKKRHEQMQA